MKDYRLDNQIWYDTKKDLIQCLFCGRWYQMLDGKHIKKHGFKSSKEYKKEYGILPKTPLKNKRLLNIYKEQAVQFRKDGIFNVFKKGETSIPQKWQKADKSDFYEHSGEYSKLLSDSLKGKRKSSEHIEKMRQNMLSSKDRYRLVEMGFGFKKGMISKNKLYEDYTQCKITGCIKKPIARYLCNSHYQKAKRQGEI